ncbi:unnamed protein product [Allacma fusca]|uniref:Intraflagellar transport protein 74 homolog n=1 Tax=Allacma fusca TaxID=39272 RepID=A0A8J2KWK4_9HEXA|nr:unnamed protein product [Allacma fusca]
MEENRPGTSRPQTAQSSDSQVLPSNRPSSRRRYGDPMTATGQRPGSRTVVMEPQRPMSKLARLQSAARPGTTFRQGSAMRTATARPPSGIATALHAPVNVMERPVTQQGVSGLRTARTSYGQRRLIHDKTYFLGILHTKMSEITGEIQKLNTSIETLAKEQSTYSSYEKRVKELVAELIEMQGELADYNILSDMIASEKDKSQLEEELKQLTDENRIESQRIETIYNRRREAEKQVQDLEDKIQEERSKADSLIQSLPNQLREKYETLQVTHSHLSSEMEKLQRTLDEQNVRKADLYDKIAKSELKRRAAQYEEELLEVEEKLEALEKDQQSKETPEQERERLLNQVKQDNSEIATLERQITEASDQLRMTQEELRSLEQEIEENDSERQQKYRELKKREEDIEEFMGTFEEVKGKELEGISKIEGQIYAIAEKISKNAQLAATLPESHGHSLTEMRDDLEFKETEFDKAKYTTEGIEQRNEILKKQIMNFENLEDKMKNEVKNLEEKTEQMQVDMKKYRDVDKLKSDSADYNSKLQKECKILEDKTRQLSDLLKTVQNEHNNLKAELENNEVHRQISTLEKKWILLEEANYNLSEFLRSKKAETDYGDVKSNALDLLKELNAMLQTKL